MYETKDDLGVLPLELHKAAIEYAKQVTGIRRPVKEHAKYIAAFRAAFVAMRDLGMLDDQYLSAVEGKHGYDPDKVET